MAISPLGSSSYHQISRIAGRVNSEDLKKTLNSIVLSSNSNNSQTYRYIESFTRKAEGRLRAKPTTGVGNGKPPQQTNNIGGLYDFNGEFVTDEQVSTNYGQYKDVALVIDDFDNKDIPIGPGSVSHGELVIGTAQEKIIDEGKQDELGLLGINTGGLPGGAISQQGLITALNKADELLGEGEINISRINMSLGPEIHINQIARLINRPNLTPNDLHENDPNLRNQIRTAMENNRNQFREELQIIELIESIHSEHGTIFHIAAGNGGIHTANLLLLANGVDGVAATNADYSAIAFTDSENNGTVTPEIVSGGYDINGDDRPDVYDPTPTEQEAGRIPIEGTSFASPLDTAEDLIANADDEIITTPPTSDEELPISDDETTSTPENPTEAPQFIPDEDSIATLPEAPIPVDPTPPDIGDWFKKPQDRIAKTPGGKPGDRLNSPWNGIYSEAVSLFA